MIEPPSRTRTSSVPTIEARPDRPASTSGRPTIACEPGVPVVNWSALCTFQVPSLTKVSRVPSAWSTTALRISPLGP